MSINQFSYNPDTNPKKIEDGGRAFPNNSYERGLSVRDYFAAKAMQGIAASQMFTEWSSSEIASIAYAQADAMLAARGAA